MGWGLRLEGLPSCFNGLSYSCREAVIVISAIEPVLSHAGIIKSEFHLFVFVQGLSGVDHGRIWFNTTCAISFPLCCCTSNSTRFIAFPVTFFLLQGLNGVDNGRIWFDHVRVPRSALLDHYASVDESGRYSSPLPTVSARFGTMVGGLTTGKAFRCTAYNKNWKQSMAEHVSGLQAAMLHPACGASTLLPHHSACDSHDSHETHQINLCWVARTAVCRPHPDRARRHRQCKSRAGGRTALRHAIAMIACTQKHAVPIAAHRPHPDCARRH